MSAVLIDKTATTNEAASLPAMLAARAAETPNETAMRHHQLGLWVAHTWSEYATRAARVGMALAELGVGVGDRVAIHSQNRPEWLFVDIGGQGIGAVPVGVYPTSPASEVEYLVGHSEASVLIVEDEEQLDKALEVRHRLPLLRQIVVIESRTTMQHLDDPQIMTFAELEEMGKRNRKPVARAS